VEGVGVERGVEGVGVERGVEGVGMERSVAVFKKLRFLLWSSERF
jgi:hypothetical protein